MPAHSQFIFAKNQLLQYQSLAQATTTNMSKQTVLKLVYKKAHLQFYTFFLLFDFSVCYPQHMLGRKNGRFAAYVAMRPVLCQDYLALTKIVKN
jgi:hypothetical protein